MKPELNRDNLVAAYLMLNLWGQFGSDLDGDLRHDFMGAPEQAGEWLEDMGMVVDIGTVFKVTKAGRMLMDAYDYHYISDELMSAVIKAIK